MNGERERRLSFPEIPPHNSPTSLPSKTPSPSLSTTPTNNSTKSSRISNFSKPSVPLSRRHSISVQPTSSPRIARVNLASLDEGFDETPTVGSVKKLTTHGLIASCLSDADIYIKPGPMPKPSSTMAAILDDLKPDVDDSDEFKSSSGENIVDAMKEIEMKERKIPALKKINRALTHTKSN